MKIDKETIRRAVLAHRGGLKQATDAQIKIIWDSLDAQTQEKYLQGVKEEKPAPKVTEKRKE